MYASDKVTVIRNWLGTGSINIFGRPFAGKDTHGRELVALFDGVLLGGGDILRNSTIPRSVMSLMQAGQLIPTTDFIRIVLPYLSKNEFADKPLILSSVGRWRGEEPGVLEATQAAKHPVKAVIYLDIDEPSVLKRWEQEDHQHVRGQRHDDTKEILETRLKEYNEKTLPVIEFYQKKGLLISIDSTLDRETVLAAIIDALYALATKN